MGNYRFRLSDMMPNAWFYKLRDMGKASRNPTSIPYSTKKKTPHHPPPRTNSSSSASSASKPFPPPPPKQSYHPGRASYYFPSRPDSLPDSPDHPRASDTLFPLDPPRKSKKKARLRHSPRSPAAKLVSSTVSAGCNCRATLGSVWKAEPLPEFPEPPESPPSHDGGDDEYEYDGLPCSDKPIIADHYQLDAAAAAAESWARPCSCRVTSSLTDIIIDVGGKGSIGRRSEKTEDFGAVSELSLPPILTKPPKKETGEHTKFVVGGRNVSHELDALTPVKEHKNPPRRSPAPGTQGGLRLRTNSPRLASRKIQACRNRKTAAAGATQRRVLSESFAVVKSSSDPQRDFRDSMVEMIVENNIRTSKDLEDLLACYLSLNSNEYHDVIVKAFERIWFDLTKIRW